MPRQIGERWTPGEPLNLLTYLGGPKMEEPTVNTALAEAMAAQALFVGLCHALMIKNPENVGLIRYAFDYAKHLSTRGSLKAGVGATAPNFTGFAEILEQLRAAAMPGHDEPKGFS